MKLLMGLLILSIFVITACSSASDKVANPDHTGQTTVQTKTVECTTSSDCDARPHDSCEGTWTCAKNVCVYRCDTSIENAPKETPEPPTEEITKNDTTPKPEQVETPEEYEIPQSSYDYIIKEASTKFVANSPNFKLVNAGEGFATGLAVRNNRVAPTTYRVTGKFYKAYDENNNNIQLENPEEINSWIDLGGNQTIKPTETGVFKIIIRTPKEGVKAGSYDFKLQAQRRDWEWIDYYEKHIVSVKVK